MAGFDGERLNLGGREYPRSDNVSAMRAWVLLVLAILGIPLNAEWNRYLSTGVASWTTAAAERPLSYFRTNPCSRSDPKDRILQCSVLPEAFQSSAKTKTVLTEVGQLGKFRIYDLDYYFDLPYAGPHLRSVLVRTESGKYRELYVREKIDTFAEILPTEIVEIGGSAVLMVHYNDGGNYGNFTEEYFNRSRDEIARLDFDPVYQAAPSVLPPDKMIWSPSRRFDFANSVYLVRVNDRNVGRLGCCKGVVKVRFQINGTKVMVTESKYDPNADDF